MITLHVHASDLPHERLVGDRVNYRGGWGSQPAKAATITGIGFKNGRPVYDLDDGHWCYDDQVLGLAAAAHVCSCCGEETASGEDCCSDDFAEPGELREDSDPTDYAWRSEGRLRMMESGGVGQDSEPYDPAVHGGEQ
jgi:hypothetical protein